MGVDTNRINFSTFISEFNDEAVDSMVAILGVAKTIEELNAELNDKRTSSKKKNQIRKQLNRIQSSDYKLPYNNINKLISQESVEKIFCDNSLDLKIKNLKIYQLLPRFYLLELK